MAGNKGKKNRKFNRNRRKCEKYASEGRRELNNPLRKPRQGNRTPH